MAASLSDRVRDMAAALVALPEADFVPALNEALRELFPGFHIDSAVIRDSAGTQTPGFETVVSTKPIEGGVAEADAVAIAACAYHRLDEAKLRDAYDRIAQVKKLVKKPPKKDNQSVVTLGVIVAADATLSLSKIADQVKALNQTVSDEQRPDMAAVFSRGVVSYGMRFPGDTGNGGWLPPNPGARRVVAPTLLQLCTLSTTTYALNSMVFYLAGQLAVFAPSVQRADFKTVLEGAPTLQNSVVSYQPNLAGTFVEVDEPAPMLMPPYWVESKKGELLLKLFYQPWQDGGVVIGEGKAPLEGMLIYAPKKVPLFKVNRPGKRQVSAVLPLSVDEFHEMAEQIAKRSGLVVRRNNPQLTIANMSLDEGSTSPFVARLWMTPLNMKTSVIGNDPAKIAEFDKVYGSVLTDLTTLRRLGRELVDLWNKHQEQVTSGQIARMQGIHVQVDQTIDDEVVHLIESIIKNAASAAKQFQFLTKQFGVDIGFMYQKDAGFKTGLAAMEQTDAPLADYLAEARKWLEPVRLVRDDLEHTPILPNRITYDHDGERRIHTNEPRIMGLPMTHFVPVLLSRLNRYVEEVLMWCFQHVFPLIGEIPIGQRHSDKPERFRFVGPQDQRWVIIYSDDDFDRV